MRKITDLMKAGVIGLLEEAGDYIDVLITGDDLGSQNAPMISPKMYRRMIKPFHAELYQEIKRRTKAKIFYHSDGNIYPLLGDLIEIGRRPAQPGAGVGRRHGRHRAAQARVRRPAVVLRRDRHAVGAALRHARRTCAPRCAAGSRTWGRAAATSWRRCTASSPTCRLENVMRDARRSRQSGALSAGAISPASLEDTIRIHYPTGANTWHSSK